MYAETGQNPCLTRAAVALGTGRKKLCEGTGRKRARTDDCHRQAKGKERKKEERKQILREEKQSISKVYLGSCCTEGQRVTNLVQMAGINILQVPYFTWCLCLTWSAVVAVLQRLRDRDSQSTDPKGDGKAHSPARKLAALLQSSIPWGLCCKNADTHPISQQTFWMTQIPNPTPFPLPSGTQDFFFLLFFFSFQIGASALK